MDPVSCRFFVVQVMRSPDCFREVVNNAEELERFKWPLLLDGERGGSYQLGTHDVVPWRWPTAQGALILVPPEARAAVLHWMEVSMRETSWSPRHVIVDFDSLDDFLYALTHIPPKHKVKPRILQQGTICLSRPLPRSRWAFVNRPALERDRGKEQRADQMLAAMLCTYTLRNDDGRLIRT